ncbi:MAG: hypothetical protein JNK82_19010 [Myxococcaceae bacterium]|nr:hypothetical protein [Myxococcaceae bacterium]
MFGMQIFLRGGWRFSAGEYVVALEYSPDGRSVAVLSAAGRLSVLEADTGAQRFTTAAHSAPGTCLAWSADGSTVVTGGQDGAVTLCDARTGVVRPLVSSGPRWVEHVACHPKRPWVAVAVGKTLRIMQLDGVELGTARELASTVTGVAWRDEQVLVGCYGGVFAFEPRRAEVVRSYRWKGSLLGLRLTPDERFIVCPTQENAVHIWKLKGKEDFEMSGFPTKVRCVVFSHNANAMANDAGKHITMWDFRGTGPAGRQPLVLEGHDAQVTFLAFCRAANSVWVVSAARDGKVKAWGEPTASAVPLDGAPLEIGAASPNGCDVTVAAASGVVTAVSLSVH